VDAGGGTIVLIGLETLLRSQDDKDAVANLGTA
jgi:hypothetical protein